MKKTILAALALLSNVKLASAAAVGKAAEALSGGVVTDDKVTEFLTAPRFRYDFECWGPKEHERDAFNRARFDMEAAQAAGDSARWLNLRAVLSAFQLERKWADGFSNLVTTAGGNDLLTQYFKGSTYTAAWFVGLVDNAGFTAIAATDTMATHSGWTESAAYSNATRPALTLGTPAARSVDNSASKASFSINASATINGAFTATNSTKSGTSGTLYSAGSFGATRGVVNGDTLQVQVTLTV